MYKTGTLPVYLHIHYSGTRPKQKKTPEYHLILLQRMYTDAYLNIYTQICLSPYILRVCNVYNRMYTYVDPATRYIRYGSGYKSLQDRFNQLIHTY